MLRFGRRRSGNFFPTRLKGAKVALMNRSQVPTRLGRAASSLLIFSGALSALCAPSFRASADDPLPELRERLAQQIKSYPDMETIQASYSSAEREQGIREFHTLTVRLQGPIQVVSEAHEERDLRTQKDYFLHENEVYALRIRHRAPAPDGKTARVSESRIFFDKGTPIYRGSVTARVPSKADADFSKSKETPVPLPPKLEAWSAQLKLRAFTIARSFRPHMGQYVFGNWDEWLLKNAPAEDPGLLRPPRPADWIPPEGTRVLPIRLTDSPDGLYRIGWGYREGPIDWKRLAYDHEGAVEPFFSTKLASGELKPPLNEDSNFLINAITGEPGSDIGLYHPGERQRFNHDEILVHWSPTSNCFIVEETAKWGDEAAGIGWIKDGKCEQTFDVLAPLKVVAETAVKKSSHPAAKRLRADDDGGYTFGIGKVLLEDDGRLEVEVSGEIPKDLQPSGSYQAIVTGKLQPGTEKSPAKLRDAKVTVISPRTD